MIQVQEHWTDVLLSTWVIWLLLLQDKTVVAQGFCGDSRRQRMWWRLSGNWISTLSLKRQFFNPYKCTDIFQRMCAKAGEISELVTSIPQTPVKKKWPPNSILSSFPFSKSQIWWQRLSHCTFSPGERSAICRTIMSIITIMSVW